MNPCADRSLAPHRACGRRADRAPVRAAWLTGITYVAAVLATLALVAG